MSDRFHLRGAVRKDNRRDRRSTRESGREFSWIDTRRASDECLGRHHQGETSIIHRKGKGKEETLKVRDSTTNMGLSVWIHGTQSGWMRGASGSNECEKFSLRMNPFATHAETMQEAKGSTSGKKSMGTRREKVL